MTAVASSQAPDLRQAIESLLPEILIAVHTSFRRYHHRSAKEEIDDLCQQVVVSLMEDDFRRLRSFCHASSRRTWLTVVVRNHVINYLERQKPTVSLNDLPADSMGYPPLEEERLIAREQRDGLRMAVTKLTKREIELFELFYVTEYSTAEIATKMGIKLQSVRRRKHALVKKLRRFFDLPKYQTSASASRRRLEINISPRDVSNHTDACENLPKQNGRAVAATESKGTRIRTF